MGVTREANCEGGCLRRSKRGSNHYVSANTGLPVVFKSNRNPLHLVKSELRAVRSFAPSRKQAQFLEVSGEIMERVGPIFFSDPMMAAMKSLGMT
jgi:hypothetical protein